MSTYELSKFKKRLKCWDCGRKIGSRHARGCDVEQCSACGMQRLSCGCEGKHDSDASRFTGYWPGELEAARAGLFVRNVANPPMIKCGPEHPDATPSLNDWVMLHLPKVILV